MAYEEGYPALTRRRLILVEDVDEKNVYYRRDDRLWKAVLEDLFEDFLHFFFPEACELFDLSRGVEYLVWRPLNSITPSLALFAPGCAKKRLHSSTMRTFFCIAMNKNNFSLSK